MIVNYCDRTKELSINFKNWNVDDIILELSYYIETGYHVCSVSQNMSFGHCDEVEVNLIETYRG